MRILRGHRDWLVAVADAPDGKTLASAAKDGVVKLWDVGAGKERASLHVKPEHRPLLRALAFSPDSALLAAAGYGFNLTVWEAATGRERATLPVSAWLCALAFDRDSRTLAVAFDGSGRSGQLGLWELGTEIVRPLPPGAGVIVAGMAFSPDGRLLAVGGSHIVQRSVRGALQAWDAANRVQRWVQNSRTPVHAVTFTPDSRALFAAVARAIERRDAQTGELQAVLKGHAKQVNALSVSPDGRWLRSGGNDRTVRLWDLAAVRERAMFDWGVGEVRSVAFAPDGMTAAVGGDRRKVVIWDVE